MFAEVTGPASGAATRSAQPRPRPSAGLIAQTFQNESPRHTILIWTPRSVVLHLREPRDPASRPGCILPDTSGRYRSPSDKMAIVAISALAVSEVASGHPCSTTSCTCRWIVRRMRRSCAVRIAQEHLAS